MPLLNTATKVYKGATLATKVYRGAVLVWPPTPTGPPPTGLVCWWDADDASTFTYSSGTVVSQWRDKSGNARHFNQATVSLQPNRNGTQNGRTTVVFDGSNDHMDTGAFTLGPPVTVFLAQTATSAGNQGWFSSVGGAFQIYVGSSLLGIYASGGVVTASGSVTGTHQWAFTFPGAGGGAAFMYRDGTSVGTGFPGYTITTTGFRLAERDLTAGYRLTGPLFEVLVYNRLLDTTERQTVEGYLRTKWGTP